MNILIRFREAVLSLVRLAAKPNMSNSEDTQNRIFLIEDSSYTFKNELVEFDNSVPTDFNEIGVKLADTTTMYYMEFITGFNESQNKYVRINGVVNCILFIDRFIQKLLATNPKSSMIQTLRTTQEILLFDRLCKCDYP